MKYRIIAKVGDGEWMNYSGSNNKKDAAHEIYLAKRQDKQYNLFKAPVEYKVILSNVVFSG